MRPTSPLLLLALAWLMHTVLPIVQSVDGRLAAPALVAQSQGGGGEASEGPGLPGGSASAPENADPDAPTPYDPAEFAPWLHDLRRAEIIAVGSYPVTVLLSAVTYEVGRFAVASIVAGQVQPGIAPLFFRSSPGPTFSTQEQVGIFITAAVASAVIATIDWLIGARERTRSMSNE